MKPMPTGAWDLWRAEVRAGLRTKDEPVDKLFLAALCDADGLDALDAGDSWRAMLWFDQAAYWVERMHEQEAA
jgi:hypothetical protein